MRLISTPVKYLQFVARILLQPWDVRRTLPRFFEQVNTHGVGSLPIIVLTSVFIGLTTAVQTTYQLMGIVPKYFVGLGVGGLVIIELAPVLTGFIVAGRSASSIAAELGAMRVSGQIDALTVMDIDPYRYLCLPRIIAVTISVPVAVILTEVVAVVTGLFIASNFLDVPAASFMYGLTQSFRMRYFFGALAKAAVFGLLIALNGCYFGFNVSGGAEQVGRATTQSVVASATFILVVDFIIALLFYTQ